MDYELFVTPGLGENSYLISSENGANVTTFGVATNRAWRNEAGELQAEVDFHNLVVFGDTAQNAAEYLVKGQLVYIEGRIRQNLGRIKGTQALPYRYRH